MDKILERVVELAAQQFSCSQMMYLLSQDYHQVENDDLVRALDGLTYGMYEQDTCGALSGACCLVALYLGHSVPRAPNENRTELILKLREWFRENHKTTLCKELLDSGNKKTEDTCPTLISTTFRKTIELLVEHGVDLYEI